MTASDGKNWVIRKQPPGHLLAGAHNVQREYTVLAALKDSDVPVPRTLLFCNDPDILGTDFYVMDFVNGRIMEDTTLADEPPKDRAAIFKSLAETAAALHRVNVNEVGLERFGRPQEHPRTLQKATQFRIDFLLFLLPLLAPKMVPKVINITQNLFRNTVPSRPLFSRRF